MDTQNSSDKTSVSRFGGARSFLADKLQSPNFIKGSRGWRANSNGEFEANAPTLNSPVIGGTTTIGTLTGVLRGDSGVVSVDSDVTDIVAAASTTAAGKVELATDAETITGTDTARAVTPANLTARFKSCVSIMPKPPHGAVAGATNQPFINDNTYALFGALVVPLKITVNKLSFWLSRTSGTTSFDIALYTEDGQTKVIDITTASISAGAAQVVTTAVSSVVLVPGVYYVGVVANGTTFNMNLACWATASRADAGFEDIFNGVSSEPFLEGSATVTAATLPATFNPTTDLTDSGDDLTLAIRLDN